MRWISAPLLALLPPDPSVVVAAAPPAPPAPAAEPPPVPPPPPTPRPVVYDLVGSTPARPLRKARPLVPADVSAATALFEEIDKLRREVTTHPPIRLAHHLQAIVAELRDLLDRLPVGHAYHDRLQQLIPVLSAIKEQGGVSDYIRGLAYHATGDWRRLAHKSRRKMAEFDMDASTPPAPSREPRLKTKAFGTPVLPPGTKLDEADHQWPALPNIRALKLPVLLAGGMLIPEKLKSVKERFGLEPEWHEIDHDNPRAEESLVQRIRNGKVGAVVLLEGVMRHSTFKSAVQACNTMNVPYAMADKAGVASLTSALDEIERKLAS